VSLEHDYTEWCRNLFGSLADGGTWGIPNSGLIFQRDGDTLKLVARMPHMPGMEISAEQLREQQDDAFKKTQAEFAKAGITIYGLEEK
jgi:hypothetical protein